MALKKVDKVQAPSQDDLSRGQQAIETTGSDVLDIILQKITAECPEAVVHVDEKVRGRRICPLSPPHHPLLTPPSHSRLPVVPSCFPAREASRGRPPIPQTHHPARRVKTCPPPPDQEAGRARVLLLKTSEVRLARPCPSSLFHRTRAQGWDVQDGSSLCGEPLCSVPAQRSRDPAQRGKVCAAPAQRPSQFPRNRLMRLMGAGGGPAGPVCTGRWRQFVRGRRTLPPAVCGVRDEGSPLVRVGGRDGGGDSPCPDGKPCRGWSCARWRRFVRGRRAWQRGRWGRRTAIPACSSSCHGEYLMRKQTRIRARFVLSEG